MKRCVTPIVLNINPSQKGNKDTHGHQNCCYLMAIRNGVFILHGFRDTTTSAVNVTACDLEKSFNFNTQLKLQATCTF